MYSLRMSKVAQKGLFRPCSLLLRNWECLHAGMYIVAQECQTIGLLPCSRPATNSVCTVMIAFLSATPTRDGNNSPNQS